MSDEIPVKPEYKLLVDVTSLDLSIVESERSEFQGTVHMKMVLRDDPDILASCAFGLIYALGVLSFADARPRGVSGMDFAEKDDWCVADMFSHLRFEDGRLHFYADYVRGRMMKTTVEIDSDGVIRLETINRGESAARWVATLQGKKKLSLVDAGPAKPEA